MAKKKDPPPYQPSRDESAGVDVGPCRSFRPMAYPHEFECATCGYMRGSHR